METVDTRFVSATRRTSKMSITSDYDSELLTGESFDHTQKAILADKELSLRRNSKRALLKSMDVQANSRSD